MKTTRPAHRGIMPQPLGALHVRPRIPRDGQILTAKLARQAHEGHSGACARRPASRRPSWSIRASHHRPLRTWLLKSRRCIRRKTRLLRALAEQHYRRAVEATHQNGSAWIGPAASYDRLGRFDLADFAYRHAIGSKAKTISSSTTGAIPTPNLATFAGQDDS
jgi:hypothetical protein